MIKVIIAVSGLVLVQLRNSTGGPIDLYFPRTDGFNVPMTSMADPQNPVPLSMPTHNVVYYFGEEADTGRTVGAMNATGFEATLKLVRVTSGWTRDTETALRWFPAIDAVFPAESARWLPRGDCAHGKPLADCKGKNAIGGLVPMLAGRLRLEGDWHLVAADTPAGTVEPSHRTGHGAPLMRLLIDDSTRSQIHVTSGRAFSDTFVFEAVVDDASWLQASGSLPVGDLKRLKMVTPSRDFCQGWSPTYSDCRLLWISNAPASNGGPQSAFMQLGDPHFSQLYRLLETYIPDTDRFQDQVFVPFGVDSGSTAAYDPMFETMGDHSPRCYGGVVAP